MSNIGGQIIVSSIILNKISNQFELKSLGHLDILKNILSHFESCIQLEVP
jgi:hypothetical protein